MLWLSPTVQAFQLHRSSLPPPASSSENLNTWLHQLETELTAWPTRRSGEEPDFDALQTQLQQFQTQAQSDFQALETYLRRHALPAEILHRHQQAVQEHQQAFQTLKTHLETLQTSIRRGERESKTLSQLRQFLKTLPRQQHAPFDPQRLPFHLAPSQGRAPKETSEEFQQVLTKRAKIAHPTAPTPADLAETEKMRFTEEIKSLAESLEHHSIKIFNWVHDHIRFLPTWGSIQGSSGTLETRAGNAVDTASLLIALLRVSGIPARYSYGTIQIPIAKAMNWVGGVNTPEAVLQLLAQGGIPAVAVTQGRAIQFVKMEQIWVQAWLDFIPRAG